METTYVISQKDLSDILLSKEPFLNEVKKKFEKLGIPILFDLKSFYLSILNENKIDIHFNEYLKDKHITPKRFYYQVCILNVFTTQFLYLYNKTNIKDCNINISFETLFVLNEL